MIASRRSGKGVHTLFDKFLFWAIILIVVWSAVPALAKEGAAELNGIEMTFWINLFALPVATVWLLPRKQQRILASYSLGAILKLAGIGFLGNLLYQTLYFSSYQTITAIVGSVMTRFSGLIFVVASVVLLKEKHHWIYFFAITLATFGAVLSTVQPGAQLEFSFTTGFWLMVVATIFNTLYQFANNAIKKDFPSPNVNLFVFKVGTLLVIGLWALLTQLNWPTSRPYLQVDLTPHVNELFIPFLLGALADGVGFFAFLKMLELGNSVKVTIITALVAVGQVFWAVLVAPETASFVNAILGPTLVIMPIAIAGYLDAKNKI